MSTSRISGTSGTSGTSGPAAVHATVEGPDGAPALVLLSSVGMPGSMWDPQVGALAEDFRMIRVDARGHGASAPTDGDTLTVAALGADVIGVLDRLGIERAHIAGLSLGGMIAAWLGVHHPQRVARLALLCTSAHPGAKGWLERAATVRAQGMAAVADPIVDRWLTPALRARDPELDRGLRTTLTTTDAETYAQCCEALEAFDLRPDLARISAPTLVIGGVDDPSLPPSHSEELAAGIPGARLELLGPAAHLANLEQAGAVTRLLLEHFGAARTLATGYAVRRSVLGDAHVDRSVARTTDFTQAFQHFLTRYAWGEVWDRPGLARRERSIATLAALVTLGAENEIGMHVRAARTNGLTPGEIGEVLLHTALYAGLPRANAAFALAQQILDEETA